MGSVPAQVSTMIEQGPLRLGDTGHTERSQWVLNSPTPPSPWIKLFTSLKHTVLPNKFFSSSKNKAFHRHAVSFLHNLFPIFSWFRDYKASKFKNDLLAGLTLASLSIPQVQVFLLFLQQCSIFLSLLVSYLNLYRA